MKKLTVRLRWSASREVTVGQLAEANHLAQYLSRLAAGIDVIKLQSRHTVPVIDRARHCRKWRESGCSGSVLSVGANGLLLF